MILDCSSPESAKKSLCKIFDVTEPEFLTLIRSVKPYDSDFQPPQDVIYDQTCEQFGAPSSTLKVAWFHGTRVEDHNSFYKHGILPKTAAIKFIEPRLKELAVDLEHSGNNPFSTSLMGKQGEHDEGPFAFLIKDVAIHAPGAHHSYVNAPEMVEDIAGTLLGENFAQLVASYQKITTSYVVTFIADSKGYEIPYALWYLKLIEDGESEIEAANAANTCFCGDGSIISPEQIQNVEHI
ncbi:hypothetical protein [Candidatus Endoriftia persephonae]|jgi:hypothetical protein|uniref:Uncharacterized protein n=1 Tax=Candidatus Endoriftia persephonae TaxID=393765 RepID=A0A9J6ZUC3_9GAMM|nr:hypothetical protein [Candidatus Endoriftia persephone]USF86382.1 hypothetical protein L0Y14_09510 [Candidatus Endoriftia persephone]